MYDGENEIKRKRKNFLIIGTIIIVVLIVFIIFSTFLFGGIHVFVVILHRISKVFSGAEKTPKSLN